MLPSIFSKDPYESPQTRNLGRGVKVIMMCLVILAVLGAKACLGQSISHVYALQNNGVSTLSFKSDTTQTVVVQLVAMSESGELVLKHEVRVLSKGETIQSSYFTGNISPCSWKLNEQKIPWGVNKVWVVKKDM